MTDPPREYHVTVYPDAAGPMLRIDDLIGFCTASAAEFTRNPEVLRGTPAQRAWQRGRIAAYRFLADQLMTLLADPANDGACHDQPDPP